MLISLLLLHMYKLLRLQGSQEVIIMNTGGGVGEVGSIELA